MPPCEIQDLKRRPFKTYRNRLQTAKKQVVSKSKCFQPKSYGVNRPNVKSPFQNSLVSSEMGFSLLVNFGLKVEGCQVVGILCLDTPSFRCPLPFMQLIVVLLGYGNSIRISLMLFLVTSWVRRSL